ncbi:MAG TPA: aldehyde dehydrogenase family protein, partial [Casimicrobiaceae bacterium]
MNVDASAIVGALVARARAAQQAFERYGQAQVDEVVTAAGWAIVEPSRNRALAELAVRDSRLGNVADKIAKNHRKTIGLLRDLKGARSVGVIDDDRERGLVEIARPVGVVAAITPSTNPAATPANNILNALKGRNAIVLAPSPKGRSTLALLLEYVHAELDRVGAPRDLVQALPAGDRALTQELMRQADLVVATGSQKNVRGAYSSGTPAIGVGAGNVSAIVDETADVRDAAARIAASKTFDNATSCSSENNVIALAANREALLDALREQGGVALDADETARLQAAMFPDGHLAAPFIAQDAPTIAARAGLARPALREARFLVVEERGVGAAHPFSGEKLSPVLALYTAADFAAATALAARILAYQGAG